MTAQVSVVLAVRNEQVHIGEALSSICEQKGLSFEVIVVDDHSEDSTVELVKELSNRYPHLSLIHNPRRGKVSAYNTGVGSARGRFVCMFSGDDIMPAGSLVERLTKVSGLSDHEPVVGLSKIVVMSENPRYDGQIIPRAKGRGTMSGMSPMMNRAAVRALFPLPEALPNEDSWIMLCLTYWSNMHLVHSDILCCRWRMHSGNSKNVLDPFHVYSAKIAERRAADRLFLKTYGERLNGSSLIRLQRQIRMEKYRSQGRIFRVLFCRAPLVERLRALASTAPWLYRLRRRMFKLFSGW